MPAPDEFDLEPVDEENQNTDPYDDLMDTEGVPYDEVFAAGPRGAREAVLFGNIPEPDEVKERYWDALDSMMVEEKERLEEDYTLKEYLLQDADPLTKAAIIASSSVDSLSKMVEDAEEDGEETPGAATSLLLRVANVGGAEGVKQRYRSYVRDETERYRKARDHIEEHRSATDDA